jgi:hypothetical protein
MANNSLFGAVWQRVHNCLTAVRGGPAIIPANGERGVTEVAFSVTMRVNDPDRSPFKIER